MLIKFYFESIENYLPVYLHLIAIADIQLAPGKKNIIFASFYTQQQQQQ